MDHKDAVYEVSRMDFFEEWQKHPKLTRNEDLFRYLLSRFDFSAVTEESMRNVKVKISQFSAKINEKWVAAGKNPERFKNKFSECLQGADIPFEVSIIPCSPCGSRDSIQPPGRPTKEFSDSSLKTKRRRVNDLIQSRNTDELVYAAEVSVRLSGQKNAANVIKRISDPSERLEKNKPSEPSVSRCLTSDEALAYYVDSKSTTQAYKQTRKWSIKAGHKVFPPLYSLRKSKVACFPPEQHIVVNETRAEIKVQAILDKTARRLTLAQEEVLTSLLPSSSYTLISKWGCDRSSGHSTYKQKFTNCDDTDEYLFVFSFVPIRLCDDIGNIVWQNPRPSSTSYCRPLKFIFSKENKEIIVSETNAVLEEINSLVPTICSMNGNEITVKHEMLFTMVDGKVCNAMTETLSTQTCFICKSKPTEMNDLEREFISNQDNLGFGLSTLHGWIRCFECLQERDGATATLNVNSVYFN